MNQPNQFEPHLKCITNLEPLGQCLTHKAATLAIVGTASDWDLRKHRAALVEWSDYAKIAGPDAMDRIYYSLPGLVKLCGLIGTARAKAFKEALVAYGTPAGALQVQAQPAYSVQPQAAYREAPQPTNFAERGGSLALGGDDSSRAMSMLTQAMSTAVRQVFSETQPRQQQPPQPSIDTVMFEQQEMELKRLQAYTASFMAVSGQTQGHELNMTDKRKPYVVGVQSDQHGQDKIITILLFSAFLIIVGVASYCLATAFKGNPQPAAQPLWQSRSL